MTASGPSQARRPCPAPSTGPAGAATRPSRTGRRRRRRRRRRIVVATAVLLVAVLAVVVAVVLLSGGSGRKPSAHQSSTGELSNVDDSGLSAAFTDPASVGAALAAARTAVVTVDSYDYRTLARNRAAGLAVTTGAFRASYDSSMSGAVTAQANQYKTVQVCSVQKTGLASLNDDATQADILVYGALTISRAAATAGTAPTPVDLNVTMKLVDGAWLIAAMEDLGQQPGSQTPPPGTRSLVTAVGAGRQAVLDLINYRRTHFDSDFQRALDRLAPTAAAQQSANKSSILAAMNAGSFDLGGTVVEVAVEDAGFDSATLLVSGHRYRQSDTGVRTALGDLRAEVAMSRVDGKWLLTQFTTIGTD